MIRKARYRLDTYFDADLHAYCKTALHPTAQQHLHDIIRHHDFLNTLYEHTPHIHVLPGTRIDTWTITFDVAPGQTLASWVDQAWRTIDTALEYCQTVIDALPAYDTVADTTLGNVCLSGVRCLDASDHVPWCLDVTLFNIFYDQDTNSLTIIDQERLTRHSVPRKHLLFRAILSLTFEDHLHQRVIQEYGSLVWVLKAYNFRLPEIIMMRIWEYTLQMHVYAGWKSFRIFSRRLIKYTLQDIRRYMWTSWSS